MPVVDARLCADTRDLATAIADAAIGAIAPEALAWWQGLAPSASASGLRLGRMLHDKGIGTDELRTGTEQVPVFLSRALDLAAELAAGHVVLAVDHLGTMLSNIRSGPAREILDTLRSGLQRNRDLALVLVDQSHGPIVRALHDRGHPLYLAGATQRITRPTPDRRPHSIPAASKTVDDGLNRLRDVGVAWQP
jgi:hypothetical protein